MWVGMCHSNFDDPRKNIQFQLFIEKEWFFVGIWGEGTPEARKARREAAKNIQANKQKFLQLIKKLPPNYKIRYINDDEGEYSVRKVNEQNLEKFAQNIQKAGTYFMIGPWLTPSETIEKGERIVNFCVEVINNLLPLYSLLTNVNFTSLEPQGKELQGILKHIEQAAYAHLLAGKNLILYGPPGVGKTRFAKKIASKFCGNNFFLFTANAEWTTYDVIGGIMISFPKTIKEQTNEFLPSLEFRKGFLTRIAEKEEPCWLIIDEINRANLDFSFGQAFTLLDIEHRDKPLVDEDEYPNVSGAIKLPKSFRIIATMNSYDRTILFSLGYALRRRFAFLELPSPFKTIRFDYNLNEQNTKEWSTKVDSLNKDETYEKIELEIELWINDLKNQERLTSLFPTFIKKVRKIFEMMRKRNMKPYNPQAILYFLAKEITQRGLIEFGYAQVIDSLKFVLSYLALETQNNINEDVIILAVDEAFLAYFVPQFEYIVPYLRREKISGETRMNIEEKLNFIIETLRMLGLKRSLKKMEAIKEEQVIF